MLCPQIGSVKFVLRVKNVSLTFHLGVWYVQIQTHTYRPPPSDFLDNLSAGCRRAGKGGGQFHGVQEKSKSKEAEVSGSNQVSYMTSQPTI